MQFVDVSKIKDLIGTEIGKSGWVLVDQDRINKFADVTEDHQFIHVDPDKAAETPFGSTVAHGFLTLSLLSKFAMDGGAFAVEGLKMGVNYGFEKVRMMSPVKVNKRVRGVFTLMSAVERVPGQWKIVYSVKVEIEGEEKPALMAEWVSIQFM